MYKMKACAQREYKEEMTILKVILSQVAKCCLNLPVTSIPNVIFFEPTTSTRTPYAIQDFCEHERLFEMRYPIPKPKRSQIMRFGYFAYTYLLSAFASSSFLSFKFLTKAIEIKHSETLTLRARLASFLMTL